MSSPLAGKIGSATYAGTSPADVVTGLGAPLGIATDPANFEVYWGDEGTQKIQRSEGDGMSQEDVVTTGLVSPVGVAVDSGAGKLYWVDRGTGLLERSDLDGANRETLVAGLVQPWGVAVDAANGKVYWTETGGRIRRANLDGSLVEDVLVGLSAPAGIAIDETNAKLVWTDRSDKKIYRANLDGTGVATVIGSGLVDPTGIAIDRASSTLFWVDPGAGTVSRAGLDGSGVQALLLGQADAHGIALMPGPCGNGVPDADEECDDGNALDGDCCSSTCHFEAQGSSCPNGDACTAVSECDGFGFCNPVTPVTCTALDQCHDAGTCDPQTGCSNPTKPDGDPCTDGDACTQTDSCQVGVCTGAAPVTCSAADQCHDAGTCDPQTGVCSNPAKPDGAACSDGDACTQTDTCQSGTCAGADPVPCSALDQCHDAGTCDPQTGACSNPVKPNGAPCSDGSACTQVDTCQSGTCTGGGPISCTALDQCHDAGTCDPQTGACSNPVKPNGAPCSDGSACTQTDTCQAGACTGANPVVCATPDQCHVPGTCNPQTGLCSNPTKPDGAPCSDGSLCTQGDTCHGGSCGGTPLVCTAQDQCHLPGQCDPQTGSCTNPEKPDGSTCDDGNQTTAPDQCVSGVCEGPSVTCGDGVLQPQNGEQCDDGNAVSGDGCSSTCELEEVCNNFVDDDHDGLIDCQQPVACACSTPARARPHEVPAEIRFVGGLDVIRLHLSVTPATPIAPATEATGVLLTNANGVLLSASLPPGALASAGGGKRFTYKNLLARVTGGITRLQIIKRAGGSYRVELEAYGDLASATLPVMSLQLSLGNDSFFLSNTWVPNGFGWDLTTP